MSYDVLGCAEHLQILRKCSSQRVKELVDAIGPVLTAKLPASYIEALPETDQIICLRSALILWAVRKGQFVPREMQLKTILADQHRRDVNVVAGTGSGKTLPIALNILLDDPAEQRISITFSPLRRLQDSQKQEFEENYGIPTAVINDSTPKDSKWWAVSDLIAEAGRLL